MLKKLLALLSPKYINHFNVIFLLLLCFSSNNRTTILASFLYLIITSFIYRSFSKGLIFSYLLFQLFLVGRFIRYEIIPASLNFQGDFRLITFGPKFYMQIILIIWFIGQLIKKTVKFDKLMKIFTLFVMFSFISAVLSVNYYLSIYYWLVSILTLYIFFYLLKKELINNRKFIFDLLKFFIILAIYESIIALLQYLTRSSVFPSLVFVSNVPVEGIDTDPNWFRPWGTLGHPNSLANFLLPMTILSFFMNYIKRFQKSYFYLLGFSFSIVGIIITLSRSSWITLGLIMIIFILIYQKKYHLTISINLKIIFKIVLFAIIPIIFLFVYPRLRLSFSSLSSGGSGNFRLVLINEAVNVINKYPLYGVGPMMSSLGMSDANTVNNYSNFPKRPHNIYLNYATELGLISTIIFFFFLFYLLIEKGPLPNAKIHIPPIYKTIFLAPVISLLFNGLFQPLLDATLIYLIIFLTIHHVYNYYP